MMLKYGAFVNGKTLWKSYKTTIYLSPIYEK